MVGKCWHRGHNIESVITGYSLNCLLGLAVNIVVNHNHTGDVSWFLPVKSDRSLSMVNLVLTAGCVTGVCNLNKIVTNRKGNMEVEERGKGAHILICWSEGMRGSCEMLVDGQR